MSGGNAAQSRGGDLCLGCACIATAAMVTLKGAGDLPLPWTLVTCPLWGLAIGWGLLALAITARNKSRRTP